MGSSLLTDDLSKTKTSSLPPSTIATGAAAVGGVSGGVSRRKKKLAYVDPFAS